jgi:hypothetical protein
MTVAALGLIGPVLGAVVQNVGTFVVVVNSARLLRFEAGSSGSAADPGEDRAAVSRNGGHR